MSIEGKFIDLYVFDKFPIYENALEYLFDD